jgi:Flp pilus assembly protein TadG
MYVLGFLLAAIAFVGALGRLHATGVEIEDAAAAAARVASQARTPTSAVQAAARTVGELPLARRCARPPVVDVTWSGAADLGTWQGGSVTVRIECDVEVDTLTGVWAPGTTSLSASVTHPVDRHQR